MASSKVTSTEGRFILRGSRWKLGIALEDDYC